MEEHGTWLHFLYKFVPDWVPEPVIVTYFIVLLLAVTAVCATRKLSLRTPSRFQTVIEMIVGGLAAFVENIVGKEAARTAAPIIGTVFIFIFSMNVFGVIPGFVSPTANINTTVALALFAFITVQVYGFRKSGFGYLKHFLGDPLWLAPLMLPIHIIGELAKPLSLAIRLFGNIYGEEMVISVLILIVTSVMGSCLIPIQFPITLFSIFTSVVQAFVFSMLFSVYIAMAIAGHEEEHS